MIDYADFLATVLEGKGPEKLPVEGPLIDAYLYSSVLAYLRPDWFQSKKFDPAFSDLCRQLSDYQEKAGRDVFFSSIAKHSKIVTESETCKSFDVGKVRYCVELNSGVVPSQDIGLLISKEPKDRKFAMRTMAKFLRRAFPKPKEALMVLSTPKPKPAMVLLTDRINSVLSPAVQYPELPTTGILPMSASPAISTWYRIASSIPSIMGARTESCNAKYRARSSLPLLYRGATGNWLLRT